MPMKQLDTLLTFEKNKESDAAKKLQTSEAEYQQNKIRLKGVEDYRLEYMKRLNQRSSEGIDSATYSQYHAFIAKLDQASSQMQIAITQAKALVEQSKNMWLKQRQKVQAVEIVRENRLKKIATKADRQEQKMFDEMASQQYIRRKSH